MKTGDTVRVRLPGGSWGEGKAVLVSSNGHSLLLSGPDLPRPRAGFTWHPIFGPVLTLLKGESRTEWFEEIFTGDLFEVRPLEPAPPSPPLPEPQGQAKTPAATIRPESLYTPEQVADLIGLHPESVRRAVRQGRIKAVHLGRKVRIQGAELLRITREGLGCERRKNV